MTKIMGPIGWFTVALASASPCMAEEAPTVTPSGAGGIEFGMSLTEVEEVLEQPLDWEEIVEACGYGAPLDWPEGMELMISDGYVARVDVWSGDGRTEDGFGIGTPEVELIEFFGERAEVEPHPYVDDGHYVIVASADDPMLSYIFETEGNTVTSFRAGKLPEVRWIEGCL